MTFEQPLGTMENPEKRIANCSHCVLGTEAIVLAPESPLDLAMILHELGHIDWIVASSSTRA